MKKNLDKLTEFIAKHFVFDEETYPELKGMSDSERLAFAIRHLALHFSKTAGKIATVSESSDHGGELDIKSIKDNIPKALINTLRLAELVDMNEDEVVKAIEDKYKDQIPE